MKKYTCLLLVILISCNSPNKELIVNDSISRLTQLERNKDFFILKEELNKHIDSIPNSYTLYYQGLLNNVLGKYEKSNEFYNKLINSKVVLNDTLMKNVYVRKTANHFNLFEYDKALKSHKKLLFSYEHVIDSIDLIDYQKNLSMYSALTNTKKQEITKSADSYISFTRDKANLTNLNVEINGQSDNFLFDTGASLSVIQKSKAEEYKLQILNAKVDAVSITGKKIESGIGICKEVKIDNILLKNVVFLIINDEDLTFSKANYEIKGIIGFPIINAFEELQLTNDDRLIVPKTPSKKSYKNMIVEERTPIVKVGYKQEILNFVLDTGASSTMLFSSFYESNKQEINHNYELQTFNVTGVGGKSSYEGFMLEDLNFIIGNNSATLNKVKLSKDNFNEESYHGNLGQDFIQKFDKMIINFKTSSILFK